MPSEAAVKDTARPDLLDDLIARHEREPSGFFRYHGLSFHLGNGICNPAISSHSIPLLETAVRDAPPPGSVLDIGCGCGFYSIYFRKTGVNRVIGIDLPSVLANARENARRNLGLLHGIEFVGSASDRVYEQLPGNITFDLIIANIPLAAAGRHWPRHGGSAYARAFIGPDSLYKNTVTGAARHLGPEGRLYMMAGGHDLRDIEEMAQRSGLTSSLAGHCESRTQPGRNHRILRFRRTRSD